jgi:hypothetical protein
MPWKNFEDWKAKGVDQFWFWLARIVPLRLVYWCVVWAGAHATTGQYGDTEVPSLTLMETLHRWDKTKQRHPSVILIRFGRWSNSAGDYFIWKRIYWRGKWTPFCWVRKRYNK